MIYKETTENFQLRDIKHLFLFLLDFYLFETKWMSKKALAGEGAEKEGEEDGPLSREPDTELQPRTLGS